MVDNNEQYWKQATEEVFTGPGQVGDEGALPSTTYSQMKEFKDAMDRGDVNYDNLTPEEKRGVDMGLQALQRTQELSGASTPSPSTGPSQEDIQSATEASMGIQRQSFGSPSGIDPYAFHPDEFRTDRPQRPEREKYAGPVLKSAILDAALSDKPLAQAALEARQEYRNTGDEEAGLRQRTGAILSETEQEVQRSIQDIDLFRPTEDIQGDLEAIQKEMEFLQAQGKQPDYVFWSTVANPQVREEVIKQFAVDDQIRDIINSTFEGMGVVDWTRNIAGIFLPGKDVYDNYQFTGSGFNADEFISNFVNNFRTMTPEKQEELLPGIIEWAKEELPELRQVEFFNALSSPEYQKDLSGFNWFNAALSAVDFAGWAATIVTAGAAINRNRKLVKALKQAEREDLASDTVATAMVSRHPEAKDMAGMDDISMTNTASPFATEFLHPDSVDGLSKDIHSRVAAYELEASEFAQRLRTGEGRLVESAFNPNEARALEELKRNEFVKKNPVENVRTVDRDNNGFTIEFEAFDEMGASLGVKQQRINFLLSDKQPIQVEPVGMFSRWVASPLTFLKGGEGRSLVKQAERLDDQQAKLLNELRTLQRESVSSIIGKSGIGGLTPASRKKLEDLDFILLKGDQEQEVYTVDQLMNGELGVTFTEDQVEAYYKTRSLMDSLLDIREDAVRKEALLRGEAGALVKDKELVVKPFAELNDAKQSIRDSGRKQVFVDGDTGVVENFDDIELEDYYAQGWTIVRLKEPTAFTPDGNKVFYALVDNDQVGELPAQILPRRRGYIPKINNGTAYFVKEFSEHTVDGVTHAADDSRASVRTVRAFGRKEDADLYAISLSKAEVPEGESPKIFRVLEDRQLEQEAALSAMGEEHALARPGGLFSGARAEELLYGLDGIDIDRVDSFTAISRNLSNLAKYVSRNEWRLGMEKMAIETANSLEGSGNRVFRTFDDLVKAPMGTENGRTIRALHAQIEDWMAWPSSEEMAFKYGVQKIIDSSIGGKLPKQALDTLFDLKNTDPAAAMRASAFHGLLGWFNPVQLWVQAQGAAVSLSMNIFNPVELSRVIRDQTLLQVLNHTQGTPEMVSRAAKILGMKDLDVQTFYQAWKRTGLEDSVLVTADHAAAARGRGVALDSLSRAADSGLMFYKAGEMFNRRIAFTTAYREIYKGGDLTDDILKTISDRAHDLMLNMSKANRAAWQKGIFGVATQFQQVSAKTVESLFGLNGNFTAGERAKIFLGQAALYGGAGVPMGTWGSQYIMELMGYDTQEELELNTSPEFVKAMNEGMAGWFSLAVLGVDANIGDRSSLWSSVESITESVLFGEGNTVSNMLGAFTGPAGEFWKGFIGAYEPMSLGMAEGRPIDIVRAISNPFLASIKTFRNADKAYFMNRYHKIVDRNFQTVIEGPFSWREELATAIGFQHNREVVTRTLTEANEVKASYRNSVVNQIVRINYQAAAWANNGEFTQERREMVAEAISVFYQSLDNNYEREKAREAVFSKLRDSRKSKEAAEWQKYLKTHSENTVNNALDLERIINGNFNSLRTELGGQGIRRQGVYDNQEVER